MIKGEKVILDVIDAESIEWMRQQRNNPEMRKYFREWKEISKDKQEAWYKAIGNNTADNHVYFEIRSDVKILEDSGEVLIGSNELIGCCNLSYIDWRLRSAELGIFLCDKARGLGYGKEALTLLFDYAFFEAGIHKIWAEVYDTNAALGIYTGALGMKVDGKSRHSQFTNGKYIDSAMISILEDEWRILRNK